VAERAAFLKAIRSRLQEYQPTRAPDAPWTAGADRVEPSIAEVEDLPNRFLAELHGLGGHGARVPGLEEAREYILGLARDLQAKRLIRWEDGVVYELAIDAPLERAGIAVSVWNDVADPLKEAARADIGLSGASYAVAETGSLVLCASPGRGRTVTLLPPTHVAVVPVERLVSRVADIIHLFAGGEELPSSLWFVTGPSRSGDIEQQQTIGVHGPGDLHVLLLG